MTPLTSDDVNDILALLDGLDVEEFALSTDRFRLALRRSGEGAWSRSYEVFADASPAPACAAGDPASAPADVAAEPPPGLLAVRAPLLGTFYRAPRPGAAPYVEIGSEVDEDTVVGIIETMKLMNSVHAGVRGRIVDIVLGNAEFAAKGVALMHVEPAAP